MIRSLKGMPDILPGDSEKWQFLEKTLHAVAQSYGYQEIRTPVLENKELFVRSVGEKTDIVQKEFYHFEDKNGDEISLRPEGTASTVRALMQHQLLAQKSPQKLYYISPMFRRERPQKGRYRQFHQMGVEYFGSHAPSVDAEIISMLMDICKALSIANAKIMLNSVGGKVCRAQYRDQLLLFLKKHKSELDALSLDRMESNPMRIFDSKDAGTQKVMQSAPRMLDHLCNTCKKHFDAVCAQLTAMQIPYEIDTNIVRGLDYYSHTAFEVVMDSGLGSQNAIAGGGRYNGLIETLGGQATPAIGFAMGIERLLMISDFPEQKKSEKWVILPLGDEANSLANALAWKLRQQAENKYDVESVFEKTSMKSGLRAVNKLDATHVIVIGEREVQDGTVMYKNLQTAEQETLAYEDVVDYVLKKSHA